MDKDLEELKTVLRSIVVSSATPVDVRTLAYEYRTLLGSRLPLEKFGYKSVVDFLRDRCQDCFVFQGNPVNPVLILIVPEKLQHIDKFVQRQKVSTAVKQKGKRRSILAPQSAPSRQPQNVYKNARQQPSTYKPKDTSPPVTKPLETFSSNNRNEKLFTNDSGIVSISNSDRICNKNVQATNNNTQLANQNKVEQKKQDEEESVKDHDSGRLTASSGTRTNRLLEKLKADMKHLLSLNPDGIWCADLMDLYKSEFGVCLPLSACRHTSVVGLMEALDETVAIHRPQPAGDWLLLSPDATLPTTTYVPTPRPLPSFVYKQKPRYDPEDALPGVPYHPSVFPEDCLGYEESIPPVGILDLCNVQHVDVIIGEVYSPSHFWLIRLGEAYHVKMEDTMDRMDEYYFHGEGRDRKLAAAAVRVGQYCAALYEGFWHRGVIVNVVDGDYVKVRHIDYGSVARVKTDSLKPLRREWAELPAQAIRARLVDLVPARGARRWPLSASEELLNLVRDTRLVAEIINVLPDELHVWLVNTVDNTDFCINQELIDKGFAEFSKETSELYSLPEWVALETGRTPQYGELCAYLRAGVELRHLPAYNLHNPPEGTTRRDSTQHQHRLLPYEPTPDDTQLNHVFGAQTYQPNNSGVSSNTLRGTRISTWKSLAELYHTTPSHDSNSTDAFPLNTTLQEDLAELRKEELLQNALKYKSPNNPNSFNYMYDQFQGITLNPDLDSREIEPEINSDDSLIEVEQTKSNNNVSDDNNSFSKFITVPFASIPCFTPCLVNEMHSIKYHETSNASAVNKPNLSSSEYVLPQLCKQNDHFTETSSLSKLDTEDSQHLKFTPKKQSRSTSPITITSDTISNKCEGEVKTILSQEKCPEVSSTDDHTQIPSCHNLKDESHSKPVISQITNTQNMNNVFPPTLMLNGIYPPPPGFSPSNIQPPAMPYYPPNSLYHNMPFSSSSPYQQNDRYHYTNQQTHIFIPPRSIPNQLPNMTSQLSNKPNQQPNITQQSNMAFASPNMSSQNPNKPNIPPSASMPTLQPNMPTLQPNMRPQPPNMAFPPGFRPPFPTCESGCVTISLEDVQQYFQMWPVSPEAAARGLQAAIARGPLPGPTVSLARLAVRVYFGLLPVDPVAAHEHIKIMLCSRFTPPPPGF